MTSESVKSNGWASYPAGAWNAKRPASLVNDVPFWQYCAERYGQPVLDLCCGNGRTAIPLAELGYEVIGVDINPDFIASARERAGADERLPVAFEVQDIVHLRLDGKFRLAIMPDWSFQVLLTQEDQLSFLQSLRQHLRPGGVFAFNVFIPFNRQRGLRESDGKYEWAPDPSYHAGAPRTYDPITQIETLVESNIHTVQLRHTSLSELELLFRLTGFEIVELYGDVDRRPFTGGGDEDYTIVVASSRVASNKNRTVALTGILAVRGFAVPVENELTLGLRRGMWRGQKEIYPVKESSFRPR